MNTRMTDPNTITHAPTTSGEDPYLVLRYCREHFLRRLEEIAKVAGITSPALLELFSQEVGNAHDELASATQQDGFEQTAGLTASRISLVGNDDLELDIRIGDVANHLKANDQIDHWRVQLRYMTLLNRPKMSAENNPVGLEPIRRGLWTLCREGGLNLEKNLDQLDRLEELLQIRLPEVYMELNGLLEHHHIEPAEVQVIRQKGPGGPGGNNASGDNGNGGGSSAPAPVQNALASLQNALRQQFASDDSALEFVPDGLSRSPGAAVGSSGNVTLSASTLVMLNHLMERLSTLEVQQAASAGSASPGDASPSPTLHALRSKDLDLPLGKPASIALDTLSLIFEAIFSAPNLPDVVKASIGRLQIPLLKQAIIDPSFFTNTQHPARQLVNRMARSAIGLAQDTGREHPLCAKLGTLADAVRASLDTDTADISAQISELDSLIAERDQALQAAARPYIQLVSEHEKRAAAHGAAADWLNKARETKRSPEINTFLAECWQRVMHSAYLEGGASGECWRESAMTIEQLLWSIEPKATAEERKQLLTLIPSLLKRVNAGLDRAGVSTEERTPFLNLCFDLQSAALRSRPSAPSMDSTGPAETPTTLDFPRTAKASAPMANEILERNGILVQYFGQATAQSPWRSSGNNAWKEGDWISFQLPDGEPLCGHLCWRGADSGTILLFNNEWGFAVAFSPAMLEQQLSSERARLLSNASLFDDAANSALGQMRPG
jgi:hypothetical protein